MGDADGLARALVDLQTLAERLRRDCPWDRAQTARTIVTHTVEEAYEVADAAASGDDEKLLDELGDLLFQTYFLSLLLEEKGNGDLAEVARRIHDKLVARHPHVFRSPSERAEDVPPLGPGEVKRRWDDLKAAQESREGIFHHVPGNLPALLLAKKVQQRAAARGFDWSDIAGPLAKVREEVDELDAEVRRAGDRAQETEAHPRVADEVGDLLFAVVNAARRLNVDPEIALRASARTFVSRVERAVELAAERREDWAELPLDEQDRYYRLAKEAREPDPTSTGERGQP